MKFTFHLEHNNLIFVLLFYKKVEPLPQKESTKSGEVTKPIPTMIPDTTKAETTEARNPRMEISTVRTFVKTTTDIPFTGISFKVILLHPN